MTIVDVILRQASAQMDHPAVLEGGVDGEVVRTVCYREVAEAVARGRSLGERGVRPGNRCGLVARQGADFILQGLEVMASGGCLFPISSRIEGATLESLVRRVKLHHVIRDGSWENIADPGYVDGQGDEAFRALHPAFIRFTSGTTHANKGVIVGHSAVVERIAAANRGLGIGEGDRILWLLPMAHHWVVSILLYLANGATVLVPQGDAASALALARKQKATVMYAAPQDFALLAEAADSPLKTGPRLAVSTASGLNLAITEKVSGRLGLSLVQALGMIEVGLPAVNLKNAREKPLSVGRPLPDYRIWLRDDQGQAVIGCGVNHSGEVMVEGPGMFSAYMDPWLPAAHGAFATGDQGYFDEDGDLFMVGRRKNRILTGGMKFFCEEVEHAVQLHPGVSACRVVAKEDRLLGEVPVAEVEWRSGAAALSQEQWIVFLQEAIPPHMIPVEFKSVENIPRTFTGKIKRW
jgi:long-chain acyl-CoA synthetase